MTARNLTEQKQNCKTAKKVIYELSHWFMIDIKIHELLKIQATPKANHCLKSHLKFAYI